MIFALALDIWEIVAVADSMGHRKRLPVVHLAAAELVAAATCFVLPLFGGLLANIDIPCNMDAPIKDCPDYEDMLRKASRGLSLTLIFGWGLAYVTYFPLPDLGRNDIVANRS